MESNYKIINHIDLSSNDIYNLSKIVGNDYAEINNVPTAGEEGVVANIGDLEITTSDSINTGNLRLRSGVVEGKDNYVHIYSGHKLEPLRDGIYVRKDSNIDITSDKENIDITSFKAINLKTSIKEGSLETGDNYVLIEPQSAEDTLHKKINAITINSGENSSSVLDISEGVVPLEFKHSENADTSNIHNIQLKTGVYRLDTSDDYYETIGANKLTQIESDNSSIIGGNKTTVIVKNSYKNIGGNQQIQIAGWKKELIQDSYKFEVNKDTDIDLADASGNVDINIGVAGNTNEITIIKNSNETSTLIGNLNSTIGGDVVTTVNGNVDSTINKGMQSTIIGDVSSSVEGNVTSDLKGTFTNTTSDLINFETGLTSSVFTKNKILSYHSKKEDGVNKGLLITENLKVNDVFNARDYCIYWDSEINSLVFSAGNIETGF